MNHNIKYVDVCCGLNWGDEAKGKIITHLTKFYKYNFVCRWAGGNNAGHTVYLNGRAYKTHLVPCGVFYGIPSIVGPDCVVHLESFQKELEYLEHHGFNTRLVKISPRAHVITTNHVNEDIADYRYQGTTSKGIAPCYRDKYARKGIRVHEIPELVPYLWDEKLYGTICVKEHKGFGSTLIGEIIRMSLQVPHCRMGHVVLAFHPKKSVTFMERPKYTIPGLG